MQQIDKEEKDWLINQGYIKLKRGKYLDLVVLNRQKNARCKKYCTTEVIAENLKNFKQGGLGK